MVFENIIFGPIHSRRLGTSLGINVMPTHKKYCNFNCIYCECGWNEVEYGSDVKLHTKAEIEIALEHYLQKAQTEGILIDSITFAGNGEPTIHPEFAAIVDRVIELRNQYMPKAQITVLSNATRLDKSEIFKALQKVDNPILKLDAGSEATFRAINQPAPSVKFETVLQKLIEFGDKAIIQTLLLKGTSLGQVIDNTSPEEIGLWLKHIEKINPRYVMLYPIDRVTPEKDLKKLDRATLETIAEQVRALGIEVKVYG